MADNYTLFSECLNNLTPAQICWWSEAVTLEEAWAKKLYIDFCNIHKSVVDQEPITECDEDSAYEFGMTLKEDQVWIHSDGTDGSDLDAVGFLVQKFMQKFNIVNRVFSLTWAETCSNPRFGEFGGGYMVVAQNDIRIDNVHNIIKQEIEDALSEDIEDTVDRLDAMWCPECGTIAIRHSNQVYIQSKFTVDSELVVKSFFPETMPGDDIKFVCSRCDSVWSNIYDLIQGQQDRRTTLLSLGGGAQ